MQFAILHGEHTVGTLTAERDGLYWCLRAACAGMAGVQRLYACRAGEKPCNLGVLQPCGGQMQLTKRISCRSLAVDDGTVFTLTPQNRAEKAGIPFCPEEPFPDMTRFCLYRVEPAGSGYIWIK